MKTTRLVDSGIYAIARHPQFVARPVMSLAVALVSQQIVVAGLGAAAAVLSWLDFRIVDTRTVAGFGDACHR